jgi:hypothetical protein
MSVNDQRVVADYEKIVEVVVRGMEVERGDESMN